MGSDVHGLVVGVTDAGPDVLQVQGLLPFLEPIVLGVPGVALLGVLGLLLACYLGHLAGVLGLSGCLVLWWPGVAHVDFDWLQIILSFQLAFWHYTCARPGFDVF